MSSSGESRAGAEPVRKESRARPQMGMGPSGMMKGENAKDFRKTMGRLQEYLGKYRWAIALVAVFSVASTVFMVLGPRILGNATDVLVSGVMSSIANGPGVNFQRIAEILLFALGLYLLSALFAYVTALIMSNLSVDISYRFRRDIVEKINRLPLSFFDKTTHGEVQSRITNDVDTINQTLSQGLTQMISSLVSVLGALVMMFTIDWRLTLATLLLVPITLLVIGLVIRRSQKHFKSQQKNLGKVNGHIEEMFSGHLVMKAFNGEERSIEQFSRHNDKLHEAAWKSQFLSGLMMPVLVIFGNINFVVVGVLGGSFVAAGSLTLGGIQAFIQYVQRFNRPLMQIANISNVLQQTAAAAERVFEFLDEQEEPADVTPESLSNQTLGPTGDAFRGDETGQKQGQDSGNSSGLTGRVEFRNVRFGYEPDTPVIKDFSAIAMPGQKIAIVGPTGAGKTTMVKLLMRFYDLSAGSILIDGTDISEIPRAELRANFAMVLQESWLYNSSVMENIRYGRPEASDEQVIEAAKAANVDHFIHTWPGGYEMEINEETSNISQGQKQLLTIARAILADPRMLILDEATSSVDTRTEVLTQKAMDRLMEGRTSFIIAHRLSTIKNADLILVMNEGDIIEQGSHQELLAADGFYADLYNSQFEQVSAL